MYKDHVENVIFEYITVDFRFLTIAISVKWELGRRYFVFHAVVLLGVHFQYNFLVYIILILYFRVVINISVKKKLVVFLNRELEFLRNKYR